jgi:hypothetical protein
MGFYVPHRFKISSTSPPPLPEPADEFETVLRGLYPTTLPIQTSIDSTRRSMTQFLSSTLAVEPIFYADTAAGVNIQLPVAEENFSRAPSVIQRKRNVCLLLCVLPPGASAGGEAVDHANFALGSSRATGAVRARRTAAALRRAARGQMVAHVAGCGHAGQRNRRGRFVSRLHVLMVTVRGATASSSSMQESACGLPRLIPRQTHA